MSMSMKNVMGQRIAYCASACSEQRMPARMPTTEQIELYHTA